MSISTLQVTIGAGVTQVTTSSIPCRQVIFQNNATHNMRVGDANTTSSRGALLAAGSPGGSLNAGTFTAMNVNLKECWVAGTQNDVLDIIYFQ
jgi:hypothetical protein